MVYRLILFLILNFGALAIGSLFTSEGVGSNWYANLNKAPWTPPGWVFGAAWTGIMICFSIYMAYLWPVTQHKTTLIILYAVQWVLNVSWNPTFFYFHQVLGGLVIITGLTVLVWLLFFKYLPFLKLKSFLLLPYGIWILIATSLNAYILLRN